MAQNLIVEELNLYTWIERDTFAFRSLTLSPKISFKDSEPSLLSLSCFCLSRVNQISQCQYLAKIYWRIRWIYDITAIFHNDSDHASWFCGKMPMRLLIKNVAWSKITSWGLKHEDTVLICLCIKLLCQGSCLWARLFLQHLLNKIQARQSPHRKERSVVRKRATIWAKKYRYIS